MCKFKKTKITKMKRSNSFNFPKNQKEIIEARKVNIINC